MEHASLLKGLETCAIGKNSSVESHPHRHVQLHAEVYSRSQVLVIRNICQTSLFPMPERGSPSRGWERGYIPDGRCL